MAAVARRLCHSLVDPQGIAPLLASRLIALNRCPGVHPIGFGETPRCIITNAILVVTRSDFRMLPAPSNFVLGSLQVVKLLSIPSEKFSGRWYKGCLNASNAFNSINRMWALHNIRHLCPSISKVLISCYRAPTNLFIEDDTIHSQEGTTQVNPLGMPMYALATVPLIRKLLTFTQQIWYTDDAPGTGKIINFHTWWDEISCLGPCLDTILMPQRPGWSSRKNMNQRHYLFLEIPK